MLNNFFEKRFQKWEEEKRTKYGDENFLNKYIPQFSNSIKYLKKMNIINVVLGLICSVIFLLGAILKREVYMYVISVLWFLITILWIVNLVALIKHRLPFWKKRIEEWKVELEQIKEKTTD